MRDHPAPRRLAMPCGGVRMGGWDPFAIDNGTAPRRDTAGPSPSVRRGSTSCVARPVLVVIAVVAVAIALVTSVGARPRRGSAVNLDQWASSDLAWQNGNLNGNNSRYPEGGIVPFRLAFEGLKAGTHSIHINYDFTAGGHKAYDFLATWNVTNAAGKICAASGGAISSMCPSMPSSSTASRSHRTPSRPTGCRSAAPRRTRAAPRRLTIWGGTITSIAGPTHAGSVNGNSTADFLVRFTSTGNAVLLAWGGHLAQSAYWDKAGGGAPDGAAQVSGAPWHMRTLQLDGAGNKNQDRSIQPSAIVGELPPRPSRRDATPDRRSDAGRSARDTARHRGPDPAVARATTPPGGGGGGGTGTPNAPAGRLATPAPDAARDEYRRRASGPGVGRRDRPRWPRWPCSLACCRSPPGVPRAARRRR